MFHVRRRPTDNSAQAQAARRRKKKPSGSGGSLGGGSVHGGGGGGGSSSGSLLGRPPSGHHQGSAMMGDGSAHSPDDPAGLLPYLVELNPDGSELRQGGAVRRYILAAAVTEVGSERPAPAHPSSPVAGKSRQDLIKSCSRPGSDERESLSNHHNQPNAHPLPGGPRTTFACSATTPVRMGCTSPIVLLFRCDGFCAAFSIS